jgi:protein-S-isoprenylcysteine O-methyltransferase Ste14
MGVTGEPEGRGALPASLSPVFRRLALLKSYLSEDLGGGPRHLKLAWVINAQKGGTLLYVGGLMWWWGQPPTAAWVYLGLHGAYGLSWLLKELTFPDAGWQRRVTYGGALSALLLVLLPYWIAPTLLVTGALGVTSERSGWLLGVCVFTHTLGLALMVGADAQKFFTLRLERGLITTGFFARVRHPNYLGEMMIYGSYALLVGHWLPWLVLGFVWGLVFATNIAVKEASMSRYPGWGAYRERAGMILPKVLK